MSITDSFEKYIDTISEEAEVNGNEECQAFLDSLYSQLVNKKKKQKVNAIKAQPRKVKIPDFMRHDSFIKGTVKATQTIMDMRKYYNLLIKGLCNACMLDYKEYIRTEPIRITFKEQFTINLFDDFEFLKISSNEFYFRYLMLYKYITSIDKLFKNNEEYEGFSMATKSVMYTFYSNCIFAVADFEKTVYSKVILECISADSLAVKVRESEYPYRYLADDDKIIYNTIITTCNLINEAISCIVHKPNDSDRIVRAIKPYFEEHTVHPRSYQELILCISKCLGEDNGEMQCEETEEKTQEDYVAICNMLILSLARLEECAENNSEQYDKLIDIMQATKALHTRISSEM